MAFTEFCCRSGGSNLNAGTRTGNSTEPGTAAFKTYTSGTWVQSTRTFTPAGGANPTTDGIAVGDFVSIYPDAATVSPYVARITTVGATTFVTDATAKSGTAPVDGALVTSASIGGAWKGPNAAEAFPFGFITNALTNATLSPPRVNFKNDAAYNITATETHGNVGPLWFQGYTTAYGDLGRATIDGGTSGASYILHTASGASCHYYDLIWANNGATGNADGITPNSTSQDFIRCVVHDVRGSGFGFGSGSQNFTECETYLCNKSGTAATSGFQLFSNMTLLRCISHDNTAANSSGFYGSNVGNVKLINCIADTNAADGILLGGNSLNALILNCDLYNNSSDGIQINQGTTPAIRIENCNFIGNGVYGINGSGSANINGQIVNCGFGSGTAANGTAQTNNLAQIEVFGSVTYASNSLPWIDAPNGDFRINLAGGAGVGAINSGRGIFTQTSASYAGTIGYPDIGAAQHLESAAAASTIFIIGS